MTTPALEITGLNKRFGGLPATKNVSLRVMPGERRLIIGPNGAGKTTLFNLITGDLRPDSGAVRLFGQELVRLSPQRRGRPAGDEYKRWPVNDRPPSSSTATAWRWS